MGDLESLWVCLLAICSASLHLGQYTFWIVLRDCGNLWGCLIAVCKLYSILKGAFIKQFCQLWKFGRAVFLLIVQQATILDCEFIEQSEGIMGNCRCVFYLHANPPSWVSCLLEIFEGLQEFMGVPSSYLHIKSLQIVHLFGSFEAS